MGTYRARISLVLVLGSLVVATMMLAGCGGGGVGPDDGAATLNTADIEGTVYAPAGVLVAGVSYTAQDTEVGVPVPDCPVEAVRERDQMRLRTGRTDERGQFRFTDLPAGETVTVRARLRSGERLMTRLRLRAGECRADVNEDTTLAAVCARLCLGADGATDDDEAALADEVAEVCLQYQMRNRYCYGHHNGDRPQFEDPADVEATATDLLAAATGEALEQAWRTRSEEDCARAIRMLRAHVQQRLGEDVPWDSQIMQQLTNALRNGDTVSAQRLADALSRGLGREIAVEAIERVMAQLQEWLGMPQGTPPGLCVAIAAVCMGDDSGEAPRLRTEAQVRALLRELHS